MHIGILGLRAGITTMLSICVSKHLRVKYELDFEREKEDAARFLRKEKEKTSCLKRGHCAPCKGADLQ